MVGMFDFSSLRRMAVLAGGAVSLAAAPASAQTPPSPQLALSFTADAADRGAAAYQHYCQDCHGTTLDNGDFGGPPLKGSYFSQHWGSGSLAALVAFTSSQMPPDRPGQLSPDTYLDLVAFLLRENGYKPGDEDLPGDETTQEQTSLQK
jgi:mono/diheme cytochrome c family protein